MSTLVIDRLDDESLTLDQPITLDRHHNLIGLKPILYVHNVPAGTFYFRMYNSSDELIKSWSFTAIEAQSAISTTDMYFWIALGLQGDAVLPAGEYTLKLESSGYTFGEDGFIGWIKNWQTLDSNAAGSPSDFSQYPYAYKLIEYAPREF